VCGHGSDAPASLRFDPLVHAPTFQEGEHMVSTRNRIAVLAIVAISLGCDSSGPLMPASSAALQMSLADSSIEVGQTTAAAVVVRDRSGAPIVGASAAFVSDVPGVAAVDRTTGAVVGMAPGMARITATFGSLADRKTLSVVASPIRINEIYPNAERPGGYVELYNPTTDTIDLSNWTITGRDVSRGFTIPVGAMIPPLGFILVNEGLFPQGLGTADEVHLFSRFGAQVDSYTWDASQAASFGRCPDGSGPFVALTLPTRKLRNACPTTLGSIVSP